VRLYGHVIWANHRVLDFLQMQKSRNERAWKLFTHILAAEQVWITRLCGLDSSSIPIWPDLSLDECSALLEMNEASYKHFVDGLTEEGFKRPVSYTDCGGVALSAPVGEILTHVALHGTYHRRQIAAVIRNAGEELPDTDFITFVRETF
jgi:uncharacterized damage-inducible protein DinB